MTTRNTKTFDTFCPECDTEVTAPIVLMVETLTIRGEDIEYTAKVPVCPICGCNIGDSRLEKQNLTRAYDMYRAAHGLMFPEEIKKLRKQYGLSLRDFSKFLGFGEQTIARYETGSIPDKVHNQTLKTASTPEGARLLLTNLQSDLPDRIANAAKQFIEFRKSRESLIPPGWMEKLDDAPCHENGYRSFDLKRVAALIVRLSHQCNNLYKTKLQKAAFFCDTYAYETSGVSLTGIRYAHAPHGPVINDKDEVIAVLQRTGMIKLDEVEGSWGEVVKPVGNPPEVFSDDELDLIDYVAEFVNKFSTSKSISEFSHTLSAWQNTKDGEIISYAKTENEVRQAVDEALQKH